MTNKTKAVSNNNENILKFAKNLGKATAVISEVCYHGIKKIKFKSFEFWLYFLFLLTISLHCSVNDFYHLRFLHSIWSQLFTLDVILALAKVSGWWHFMLLFGGSSTSILFLLGAKEYRKRKRIKDAISDLSFSTKSGKECKVDKIIPLGEDRFKVLAYSGGKGIDKFREKKSDLAAGLGMIVEHIQVPEDNLSKVDFFISEKPLTKMFSFKKAKEYLTKPYHFVVGQNYDGPIVQNIRELPHMFIAGTTGGGKSTFFNNVILSLMHSSKKIQFYLIDLKRGLEVMDYENFPRVKIANTSSEALQMLKDLNDIMDARIDFLKLNRHRKIEPERDNKDVIIVAFDEVSEVFDKSIDDKDKKKENKEIYNLSHRLARLSRAAGFNLIFATQKIQKTLLPTEIQANIGGRTVFKTQTSSDSVTALGKKDAYDLPDVRGRAIWSKGNKYRVVQAPFLEDSEIRAEADLLKEKFTKLDKPEDELKAVRERCSKKSKGPSFQDIAENKVG